MTKKEFNEVAARYLELASQISTLEKEKAELRDRLQKCLKDNIFETKQFRAWKTEFTQEKFCTNSFREEHPKMYKNYVVTVDRSNFYCKEV